MGKLFGWLFVAGNSIGFLIGLALLIWPELLGVSTSRAMSAAGLVANALFFTFGAWLLGWL